MWKLRVYQVDDLILEHSQTDYSKVLKFGVQSLVELMNNNIKDFRVVMTDKQGYVYFMCVGEQTHINDIVKDKKGEEQEPIIYRTIGDLLGDMKV